MTDHVDSPPTNNPGTAGLGLCHADPLMLLAEQLHWLTQELTVSRLQLAKTHSDWLEEMRLCREQPRDPILAGAIQQLTREVHALGQKILIRDSFTGHQEQFNRIEEKLDRVLRNQSGEHDEKVQKLYDLVSAQKRKLEALLTTRCRLLVSSEESRIETNNER